MPVVQDPRYTQSAVAGAVNTGLFLPSETETDPTTMEMLGAAARESNIIGAGYQRLIHRDPDMPDAPAGWDALDHIQGYEQYAARLADAVTPSELQGRINRITAENQDKDVLRRSGLGGTASSLAFTMLDPTFLVSAAVPEIAGARLVTAAVRGAVGAAAYEAGMQALQEQRSATESLLNIGGGAVLSGVLGRMLHSIPASESAKLRSAIDQEAQEFVRSEAGAAAVARPTTLAEESIATGARGVSKGLSKAPLIGTDLDKVMNADSVAARTAMQDLADVPQMLEKNLQGVPTPTSVEAAVIKHDARVADFIDLAREQWVAYRQRVPRGERMKEGDFYTSIASAARRGDTVGVPEVDEAAKFLRSRVFDPLKDDAQKLGLMPDPAKVAEEKALTAAVDDYVKAESGQIYTDFASKARSRMLKRRDFRNKARAGVSEPGSYGVPEIEDATNKLRDLMLESAMSKEQGGKGLTTFRRRTQINKIMDDAYDAYVKRLEPESRQQFVKRAAKAGASDADPDVQRMAKLLQEQETGRLNNRVKPKSVDTEAAAKPLGAESYFRRMYDREAIRANLAGWHDTLTKWFARDSKVDPAEIKAAVEDVTKKILGADVGQANYGTKITVSTAGPLKERTLDIPDEMIEKFLVNDPVKVARSYVRDLAPQVELARRFGDVDMKQRVQSISDEYNILREKVRQGAGDAKAKSKALDRLTTQEKETLDALLRVRDRILGRATKAPQSEGGRRAVAASRNWRNVVVSARLGGTAVTGGQMDTAKIAAVYGFLPTINKLVQLTTSKAFRELSKTQARRAGAVVEVALSRRVQTAYDGAITEGWSEKLANGVYKWTGLNHITDFNRTVVASLFEDRVLKAAARMAEGKALAKFERASLASLGLGDDEMMAIARQVAKHGGEVDGIRVSGSADWTDKALADIYDAAILKESRIAVQQPGAADRVWWMDSEVGKLVGQLKSFSLSGPTRLLSGGLQMAGQREYAKAARFFGFMMIGGYLTHTLRQVLAGKQPTTDPKTAAFEAFTESGIGGVMPDLLSPIGRRLGVFGESVRYSDRNALSAYGGPALGAAGDVYDFAFNRTEGGLSAADVHMLRRMLPYNNVWWLRREINALEGELSESLDLKGADTATFAQRMMRTDAVLAAKKRGGTGMQVAQVQ
jgi:hypothetical protein